MDQIKAGAFLKDLRKDKGITQEQLAEELGVSGRTISRWETGKNMPDISLLVEIAEFFDVSIPEIIKGERKSVGLCESGERGAGKEYSEYEHYWAHRIDSVYDAEGDGLLRQERFISIYLWNQRSIDLCDGINVPFVYDRSAG